MVVARVAADTDKGTLVESMRAIASNGAMYSLSASARFLSGLTLIGAGWFLLRIWKTRCQRTSPVAPYLFIVSGAGTVVSGACAIGLSFYLAPLAESLFVSDEVPALLATLSEVRKIAGKVGFAIAGVALVVSALYQWRLGGAARLVATVSVILGIAMQFIWIDAATIIHRSVGAVFFLWLLVIGLMLATGQVERLYLAASNRTA